MFTSPFGIALIETISDRSHTTASPMQRYALVGSPIVYYLAAQWGIPV